MSFQLHKLFSAALPLAAAVAVATTQPDEKGAQPKTTDAHCTAETPAKPTPTPTPSTKAKERRPLQPWGRYLLSD